MFSYDLPILNGSISIWIYTCISQTIFLETMCSHLETHAYCKRVALCLASLI